MVREEGGHRRDAARHGAVRAQRHARRAARACGRRQREQQRAGAELTVAAAREIQREARVGARAAGLRGRRRRVLWQSFAHPRDTLLPGQSVAWGHGVWVGWSATRAWRSGLLVHGAQPGAPADHAPGGAGAGWRCGCGRRGAAG